MRFSSNLLHIFLPLHFFFEIFGIYYSTPKSLHCTKQSAYANVEPAAAHPGVQARVRRPSSDEKRNPDLGLGTANVFVLRCASHCNLLFGSPRDDLTGD